MRALKYYVASSVDGFIAHRDGSFDGFVPEGEHVTDFFASYAWFDIVLMGRKTYEVGLRAGVTNPYPTLRSYVFSRSLKTSPDPNVRLVSQDALEVIRGLRAESGKDIWLCGGADLAAQVYGAGLVDELVIKLNPIVLGSGIPLFATDVAFRAMELTRHKIYDNGVVLLHYRLRRPGPSSPP